MGTYIISGGTVKATGGEGEPGIGSGRNAIGGTVKVTGGKVTSTGGGYGPGIGLGANSKNGIVEIAGGMVTATGGERGAGIGGGYNSSNISISISGGDIIARGGSSCPGIGAGSNDSTCSDANTTISISGGIVDAAAGMFGAGIGASEYTSCGAISISGGTVNVPYSNYGRRIGEGRYGTASSIVITGGAVYAPLEYVVPAPTNTASKAVFPVDFEIGEATNKVSSLALYGSLESYSYGVKDLYTDADGKLRVWFPATDGAAFVAKVVMDSGETYYFSFDIDANGKITPHGYLIVNDGIVTSDKDNSGRGWSFAKSTGIVTISADAVIQGFSTNGEYRIAVPTSSGALSVTLRNLTLVGPVKQNASAVNLGRDATLSFSGWNTVAAAGKYSAGIEVASTATLKITGTSGISGTLCAIGGQYGAGIGSSGYNKNNPPGRIVIESGTIVAQGGEKAAGIGGGLSSNLDKADNILISGGRVIATGGASAAGIGAGGGKVKLAAGAVRISGGTVTAAGCAAPAGAFTEIAAGGIWSDLVKSLGNTLETTGNDYTLRIDGGSVVPANGKISPRPTDSASNTLYAVVITGLEPNAKVDLESLTGDFPSTYSLDDVCTDGDGRLCFWLAPTNRARVIVLNGKYFTTPYPYTNSVSRVMHNHDVFIDGANESGAYNMLTIPYPIAGTAVKLAGLGVSSVSGEQTTDANGNICVFVPDGDYSFTAGPYHYVATVAGAPATAQCLTGVYVDGVEAGTFSGAGWRYGAESNVLEVAGAVTISGTNTEGGVAIKLMDGAAATFSNLALATSAEYAAAVRVADGASAVIALSGSNTLASGRDSAGLQVDGGAAVTIRGTGSLSATGGSHGAGIGGGADGSAGTISIESGEITAQGGSASAGIGGGYGGAGGTIAISGGTVTATGVYYGAGIGGGYGGAGGTIAISGGTVTATGGSGWGKGGAGIGGGYDGFGGNITISGGMVTAAGGTDSAGIGGGKAGESGVILISGGIVKAASGGGADIGDGDNPGRSGEVISISITGGTVFPSHGAAGYAIGHAFGGASFPPEVVISGGSVAAVAATINPPPVNPADAAVFRVEVDVGAANRKVQFAGLENYGTGDIWSDENGKVYLWLPAGSETPTPALRPASAKLRAAAADDGTYRFAANSYGVAATVAGGGAVDVVSEPLKVEGFTINSFRLMDDEVVLNVSAYPETWMAGFFDKVKIRVSATLPIPDDDSSLVPLSGMTATPNADGTVTVAIPVTTASKMFYRIEEE